MSYQGVPQQKRVFTGVMDQDSAPWEVALNNYRRAVNLENNFVEGQSGSQTNLRGFSKVENPNLPAGTNVCIGAYEDVAGKSCLYALWNSNGYHGWYRYFLETQSLETVYAVVYPQFYDSRNPDPLNFQQDKLITGVDLVGDLLYYTDAFNQPREINVVRANNTGKRKQFNFYFNPTDNSTASKTYTLSLYQRIAGTPVETFTWVSNAPATMASRVKDFIRNVQSSYFITENMGDFARVTMSSPGSYHFVISNGTAYADTISPENFYPDYDPDLAQNYEPLPWDAFNRAKKPPTCGPEGTYVGSSDNLKSFNVRIPYQSFPLGNLGSSTTFAWLGMDNKSTAGYYDTGNLFTLGGSSPGASGGYVSPSYPMTAPFLFPSAYWTSIYKATYNVTVSIGFTTGLLSGGSDNYVEFVLSKYNGSGSHPVFTSLFVSYSLTANTNYNFTFTVPSFVALANEDFGIQVLSGDAFIGIRNISGTVSGTAVLQEIVSNKVDTHAYMFRSAYKYKDYEQSVMSDSSVIPLPLNLGQDNIIRLDYSDKLLTDMSYASQITDVLLYVSDDGGTTWNQFKDFPQQEWITQGTQVYDFNDTDTRIAVASTYATKEYDVVPIVSNSQAYIDQRIFDGGITEGYDSPTVSFNTVVNNQVVDPLYLSLTIHPSLKTFRKGYKGLFGIVYYDDYDRKSGVCLCENSEVNIPRYDQLQQDLRAVNPVTIPYVSMTVTSEPPSWATKWRVVRTKDLTQSDYLIYIANDVVNNGNQSVINLNNLGTYLTNNPTAQTSFNFVAQDRVRYLADANGTVATQLYEGVILSVGTLTFTVQWDLPFAPQPGFVFEAYTPTDLASPDLSVYYEIGECNEVAWGEFNGVWRKYHKGTISNQSYGPSPVNAVTPAQVDIFEGGVYARVRDMQYDLVMVPQYVSRWITDANAYEFAPTKYDGTGRPCVVDKLGQQVLGTAFRFSNQYVIGTTTNGLSANEPLNFDAFADIYGHVTSLKVLNDDVLRFIFSNSYMASIYVNQGLLRQTGSAGSSLISLSQQVAGNSHIIKRAYGTTNPESVVIDERGFAYGWDQNVGSVWVSGNNEPEPISALLMRTPFKRYSNERKVLDQLKNHTPAVFDLYKQVYYITLNPLAPRPTVMPKATLVLDDLNNTFGYPLVTISIPVLGLYLYSATATNIYLSQIVTDAVNNYGDGWSAVINDSGRVEVTAGGLLYNDYMIAVSLDYGSSLNKSYKALMEGGSNGTTDPSFDGITLAFSPNRKGWIQECSFLPEMYGRIGNQVLSFKDGELWLHDSNDTYNNFYGVQYGSKMQFVLNGDYPKVKVPLSVWYRGQGAWGSKLTVPPSDSYPTGMETEMIPSQFRLENNGYYASVLRNKLDPRFTDVQEAWVNGDSVTGATVDVELYCDNNSTQTRLESANTTYFYNENS